MDISLMVEGQNGLTWNKWSNILRRSEDAGLSGVFRSDHFFIGTQQDSLEPYLSFTMAALQTERIRFGPLVTPVTFRPPVNVGRMAAQLDQLSNGRFVMGLGGGWNESEHVAYGVPFPPVGERLSRLEEAIHVMRALWGPGPASYEGRFYTLKDRRLPAQAAGGPSDAAHRRRRRAAHHALCGKVRGRVELHQHDPRRLHPQGRGAAVPLRCPGARPVDAEALHDDLRRRWARPGGGRRRLPGLHAKRPLHVNRRHYVRRPRAGHESWEARRRRSTGWGNWRNSAWEKSCSST